ncbi:MAG TPA: alpha/beta fold hydrolase [Candidatus Sulfotelmatobacter sp.]|nr:alpha/beta fold hydrolase [Candidatus Sulfotelmatobacter sp.]
MAAPSDLPPVTPAVVRRQVVLDELDLHPDGTLAVLARRRVRGVGYERDLLLVPMTGRGRTRVVRRRGEGAAQPRFAPDGRYLAYLAEPPAPRAGHEAQAQVWILPLVRGEAWQLTRAPHGVSGFAWAPDGRRIAFWGWQGPPRFLVGARSDGKTPTARRITSAGWQMDETGHLDYRTHLGVIPVRRGARATALTAGDFDVTSPAWDADGRSLVFCADRGPDRDLYSRPRVWRVPAEPGAAGPAEPQEVAALPGLVDAVAVSPDGRWLALTGTDVAGAPDWAPTALFLAPAGPRGGSHPVALAPDLDRPIGDWTDSDLHGWSVAQQTGPCWAADPPAVVAVVTERGRSHPVAFPYDPATGRPVGALRPLVGGDRTTRALAAAGGRVALLATDGGSALELAEVQGGTARRVTRLGSAWQRRLEQPAMADRWIPGPGGPIETWIASPPGTVNAMLPLVVDLHGGPLGGWAPAPSLEVQILCSAGYRVALPNIRGSAGYGAAWVQPHLGHWGGPDAEDVLAVVDALVAERSVDPRRVGLLGLSYGGFLVNWLVGAHPDRWSAAVSDGGVTDQVVAWSASYDGPDYDRRAGLGDPLDEAGVARLWAQSPLRHVAAIRAPLLLLQGEADLNCPVADNQALYIALKALGREVELVLYPESWHVFSAAGRPDRRIDRHQRMLAWFQRHMPTRTEPPT